MENKRIVMGSDHAGYNLKLKVKAHLEARGFEVMDVGTHTTDSCNYTVYADALCKAIAAGEADLGILVCGTGIGMSMAANKHAGIRAACCSDTFSARLTREHNDANVLVMPGRFVTNTVADRILKKYFKTPFEGGRHARRIEKIPCC